jgi:hypothetical protein
VAPPAAERNLVRGFQNLFLNANLVNVRSIRGVSVAHDHLALVIESNPSVEPRDFVIGYHYLAVGGIPTDHQALGTNSESALDE